MSDGEENSNLYVSEEPGDRVRLSGQCVVTGKPYSVVVPLSGAIDYFERGRNIAEAFPNLPKPEWEFLVCSPTRYNSPHHAVNTGYET